MRIKLLSVCDDFAPVLYITTVTLGCPRMPIGSGYSPIAPTIGELIETGATEKSLLDALSIIYKVVAGLFKGLWRLLKGLR